MLLLVQAFVFLACALMTTALQASRLIDRDCTSWFRLPLDATVVRNDRQARRIETVRRAAQDRFPKARRITPLANGAESLIFEVAFHTGHSLVLKTPTDDEIPRLPDALMRERRIIRDARIRDSEGARYLVQLYGMQRWEEINSPVLMMGMCNLGTLENNLGSYGPLRARDDPKAFLAAWCQVALAVRALHRVCIVHRDIKPGNILMQKRGSEIQFLLSDLGISGHVGEHVVGLEGLITGTLSHMSQNQLARGTCVFEDDLYSLLMTFKEMLIGNTIWHLDPRNPDNHVRLQNIDDFGTYPILDDFPEAVEYAADPILLDIADRQYSSIDSLLAFLRLHLRRVNGCRASR